MATKLIKQLIEMYQKKINIICDLEFCV